jgi:hypothetical protein
MGILWASLFIHYTVKMHEWAEAGYGMVWQYYVVETWGLLSLAAVCLCLHQAGVNWGGGR